MTSLMLVACAASPRSGTSVILMPDENGIVGAVSLKAGGATQIIDQAYYYSSVNEKYVVPGPVRKMGKTQVNREFSRLIKAQPRKPAGFVLFFVSGTTELIEESKNLLPEVLKAAKESYPSEVMIIGHSDRAGSKRANLKLSLDRAKAVEQLLKAFDSSPRSIYVRSHGENDPMVPTPDNVPEPNNRCVEILIL
jgi:outer membrane protein OmpA-like peptidoglycan-associated protein